MKNIIKLILKIVLRMLLLKWIAKQILSIFHCHQMKNAQLEKVISLALIIDSEKSLATLLLKLHQVRF